MREYTNRRGDVDAQIRYKPAGETLLEAMRREEYAQVLIGPLGSAKTTHSIVKMVRQWGRAPIDPTDNIRRSRWAAVRNTYPDLMTTTIKDFEEIVGPLNVGKLAMSSPPTYTARFLAADGIETHVEVFFLAFDIPSDVKKARGLRLSGVWFNELKELSKANVDMVMSRLGRFRPDLYRAQPDCWYGMLGDSNAPPSDHWLAELVKMKPPNWWFGIQPGAVYKQGGKFVINQAAENLQNLSPGYYENMLAGKDEMWIRQNLGNEFVFYADGRPIHSEFNQRIHVSEYEREPVLGLPLKIGVDFGRTPSMVVAQRQVHGQWWVLRELCTKNMAAAAFGRLAKAELDEHFPGFDIDGHGDPAGDKAGEQIDDTCIELVNAAGLTVFPAPTNNFTERTDALDSQLTLNIGGEPAIVVNPSCRVLIDGLSGGYQFRRMQVAGEARYSDKPDKNRYSHVCEALHYLLLGEGESTHTRSSSFSRQNEQVIAERGGWHMPASNYE